MTVENTAPSAEGTATPAVPQSPTQPAPAQEQEPNWLPMRLAQAKRSAETELLKSLGVADVEAARAALTAAKKLEDEKKSEIQRLTDAAAALKPLADKAPELEKRLVKIADSALAGLTAEQRAAVESLIGDDKTRALDVIDTLRPTWAAAAKAQAEAEAEAKAKTKPAPATTTAAGAAPTGQSAGSVDHRAVYESLTKTSPYQAAQYLLAHKLEIYPPAR